jgi:hypothetical protein
LEKLREVSQKEFLKGKMGLFLPYSQLKILRGQEQAPKEKGIL